MKVEWKFFIIAFPFICDSCNELLWEKRAVCEGCGKTLTIRKTLKKDYKLWKKAKKK